MRPTDTQQRFVWILNPDCEGELAAQKSYAVRSAFMERIVERQALFEALVQADSFAFAHQSSWDFLNELRSDASMSALLWCPTTSARLVAEEHGLHVPMHPSMDTLRLVHDKRYLTTHCSELALSGRQIIESLAQWESCRSQMTSALRSKRFFGYAGRGQRTWTPGGNDDPGWVRDSLRKGGFIVEPYVENAAQLSVHGFVDARGALVGAPCHLSTDRAGAPTQITQVDAASLERLYHGGESISSVAHSIAKRLYSSGYWGPFGLDLLWVEGRPAVIDLNPRFTLGWSVGMGALRDEALRRALLPSVR